MTSILLILLYGLIESARTIRFDENFIYLILISGLFVSLFFYLKVINRTNLFFGTRPVISLNRMLIELYRFYITVEHHYRWFRWLGCTVRLVNFRLNGVVVGNKVVQLGLSLFVIRNSLNMINRFLQSTSVNTFIFIKK